MPGPGSLPLVSSEVCEWILHRYLLEGNGGMVGSGRNNTQVLLVLMLVAQSKLGCQIISFEFHAFKRGKKPQVNFHAFVWIFVFKISSFCLMDTLDHSFDFLMILL